MIREVMDLKYEGAPPISIVAPKFKEKPRLPFKPRQWYDPSLYQSASYTWANLPREETPFANSARKDGLILRHWRRKGDVVNGGAAMPVTPADSNAASEMETDDKAPPTVPDAYWAKYNVKVARPQYTDEQYETHLKSDDWSKEETDYLVDLATEFDLRWIIIGDRYDYKPREQLKSDEDSMAVTPTPKPRTQEDLKARYYDVAAKTMVLPNPLSSMAATEFDAPEKMTKFDPEQETKRKRYAELLLSRTKDEKEEEEHLLRELSRIVANQDKLIQERKALFDRLEAAPSSSSGAARDSYSSTMYQTSQGLTQLMQTLFNQNKAKELERKGEKRRSLLESGDASSSSAMDRSQRHSLSGAPHARLSTSSDPHGASGSRRPLTAVEERKYGVSHPHERLTGGIQFRHERITKAGQAKSGVQTSRIGAALTELKIPPRLMMPTARVVTEYERLIEGIKGLLEIRKVSEKVDGEIRVLMAQRELLEKRERGEDVKEEEAEAEAEADKEEPGLTVDAEKEDENENEFEHKDDEGDKEMGGTEMDNVQEENEEENDDDEDGNEDEDEEEDEENEEEKESSDEEVNQEGSEDNEEDDAEGDVDENIVNAV